MQLPLYLSQSTGSINKLSADLSFNEKSQSSGSAKSSSLKSSDEKQSKKEKDFTLKMEKKDLKNKENIHRGLKTDLNVDFRNPILALSPQKGEMSLRQFSSVTELLGKLKVDLKLSFPRFVINFSFSRQLIIVKKIFKSGFDSLVKNKKKKQKKLQNDENHATNL